MKNCKNCAWYCHADGKCYGCQVDDFGGTRQIFAPKYTSCDHWTFDGLQDWEREACEPENALVTMEVAK